MRKILIAVPCMDSVPAQFAHSLATLTSYGIKDCEISIWFNLGSLIYTSRNEIAKRAIQTGADLVMWFDSDMVFNPDTLTRMLNVLDDNDLDMLSGIYYRRTEPFSPVIYRHMDIDEEEEKAQYDDVVTFPNELFEIEACGFGCVLMKTEMFIDVYTHYGNMFSPIGNIGEDIAFCWRARQCGYKIYAEPSIMLGHVSHTVVTKDFFKNYRETVLNKEKGRASD